MPPAKRRYVRQMPRVYGNLHQPRRRYSFSLDLKSIKRSLYLIGCIGLVYVVFFGPMFRVKKVEVAGTQLSDVANVSRSVPSGNNIWLLPSAEITSNVLSDPLIESVKIYRGIPDSVRLVVEERQPALLWVTGGKFILIDHEGVPFAELNEQEATNPSERTLQAIAKVPKVIDEKAIPVTLGEPLLGVTFLNFMDNLTLEMNSLLPRAIIDRYEVSDTTYDLTLVTKEGMRVQFNTLGDAGVQVRNLARLFDQNKVSATSRVDLRIDRWAYVVQ